MSVKVGIISDSHGPICPEVLGELATCDYILHAGDFAEERVLNQIRFMGKLYAVRGNNDGSWATGLSRRLRFRIEDLEFLMVHNRYDVGSEAAEADIIVFGHTHRYTEAVVDGRLWFNPGSCGRPRFGGGSSFAVMRIEGKHYTVRKIPLSD